MWGSKTRDLDAPGEPRPELVVLFLARRLSGFAGPLAVAVDFSESDRFTVLVDGHRETSPTHGTHGAPDVYLRTDASASGVCSTARFPRTTSNRPVASPSTRRRPC